MKIHPKLQILGISHGRYGIDEGHCRVIEGWHCRSHYDLQCSKNPRKRTSTLLPLEEQDHESQADRSKNKGLLVREPTIIQTK